MSEIPAEKGPSSVLADIEGTVSDRTSPYPDSGRLSPGGSAEGPSHHPDWPKPKSLWPQLEWPGPGRYQGTPQRAAPKPGTTPPAPVQVPEPLENSIGDHEKNLPADFSILSACQLLGVWPEIGNDWLQQITDLRIKAHDQHQTKWSVGEDYTVGQLRKACRYLLQFTPLERMDGFLAELQASMRDAMRQRLTVAEAPSVKLSNNL